MDFHSPDIFKRFPSVQAGFTYANRNSVNTSGTIPGLNLGENTSADTAEIDSNFSVLMSELELNSDKLALAEQVHGNQIEYVQNGGIYSQTDGLVTDKNNLILGIRVADCAAILLADPQNQFLAAVHAGWKGAASGIISRSVSKLKDLGAKTDSLIAWVSPCISSENFEIGEEVAGQFDKEYIDRNLGEKPHLKLKDFIKDELIGSGLSEYNVEIDLRCTISNKSFYSYRKEQNKAGRQLAFIQIRSN